MPYQCANKQCGASLSRLRDGQTFVVEQRNGHLTYLWLCRTCAAAFTVRTSEGSFSIVPKPKPTAVVTIYNLPPQPRPWAEVLEQHGHRVYTASTVKEAMRIVQSNGAECIIVTPGASARPAVELYHALREGVPGVPIIFILHYGMELPASLAEVHIVYRESGPASLLTCIAGMGKPAEPKEAAA